ncbi:hypothetical protein RRG08_043076 [Elysia crispata]|uniref:Uncharacterized protein n=1 Tax=Elysia crispata TaxID=231223 RepID=A0AAE0XZ42_9GAST|nr:hypothetical protein RRG08_043076 [Elysia crispata]
MISENKNNNIILFIPPSQDEEALLLSVNIPSKKTLARTAAAAAAQGSRTIHPQPAYFPENNEGWNDTQAQCKQTLRRKGENNLVTTNTVVPNTNSRLHRAATSWAAHLEVRWKDKGELEWKRYKEQDSGAILSASGRRAPPRRDKHSFLISGKLSPVTGWHRPSETMREMPEPEPSERWSICLQYCSDTRSGVSRPGQSNPLGRIIAAQQSSHGWLMGPGTEKRDNPRITVVRLDIFEELDGGQIKINRANGWRKDEEKTSQPDSDRVVQKEKYGRTPASVPGKKVGRDAKDNTSVYKETGEEDIIVHETDFICILEQPGTRRSSGTANAAATTTNRTTLSTSTTTTAPTTTNGHHPILTPCPLDQPQEPGDFSAVAS